MSPESIAAWSNGTLGCSPKTTPLKYFSQFSPMWDQLIPPYRKWKGTEPAEVLAPPVQEANAELPLGEGILPVTAPSPTLRVPSREPELSEPADCACIPRAVGVTNRQLLPLGAQIQ